MKRVDRDTYITRYRPEYSAIQYVNQNLPENARVMCLLIGNRTYYLDRDFYLFKGFFYKNASGEITEKILLQRLKRYDTTHIILGVKRYHLNKLDSDIFKRFFKNNTKILFENHGYQVLEVIKN